MPIPKYLKVSDMSPEMFESIRQARIEAGERPHRRILDFVDIREEEGDEDGKIKITTQIQKVERPAHAQGSMLGQSVAIKQEEVEKQRVEPFHTMEHVPFTEDSKYVSRSSSDGEFRISREGMAYAVNKLDRRRMELLVYSVAEAINNQQFTYVTQEGEQISVPYGESVTKLSDPGDDVGSGNFEPYNEYAGWKDEYSLDANLMPDTVLMNGTTAAKFTSVPKVEKKYRAQQPNDVPNEEITYREFVFDGIRHVVLYGRYKDQNGNTHKPISDGKAIWLSRRDEDGNRPAELIKLENNKNAGNASRPFISAWNENASNPWRGAVGSYDNLIPNFRRKYLVRPVTYYT